MKSTFVFLTICVFLVGCSLTTKYAFKDTSNFSDADFALSRSLGIAILGDYIPNLESIVEDEAYTFSGRKQTLFDISKDVVLTTAERREKNRSVEIEIKPRATS